nr:hypothetical protein CFP56_77352 [Quercus suber]
MDTYQLGVYFPILSASILSLLQPTSEDDKLEPAQQIMPLLRHRDQRMLALGRQQLTSLWQMEHCSPLQSNSSQPISPLVYERRRDSMDHGLAYREVAVASHCDHKLSDWLKLVAISHQLPIAASKWVS